MHEVVIIGAGIAGASCAYFLGQLGVGEVVLLERETSLAVHSTGRSAAVVHALVEDALVRRLILRGAEFLRSPPAGFSEHALLDRAGSLTVFSEEEWQHYRAQGALFASEGLTLEFLDPMQSRDQVSVLEPSAFAGAAWTPDDGNVDVEELLQAYVRGARQAGVALHTGVTVEELLLEDERCVGVRSSAGEFRARTVVNAAGAWAGTLGRLARALPIDIQPRRRSVATFAPPAGLQVEGWPLVAFDSHSIYFKPESGGLLMSPMDVDPVEPCDPRPSDIRIAEGMERLADLAPSLVPRTLKHRWAGLRSFAPDRLPVVGEDPLRPGFFWLAGQGGVGIETSPALGRMAAELLARGHTSIDDAEALHPRRFQQDGDVERP